MKGLLFTYGMTYGGAFVSLFNPFYGLLIYVCFAILKPPALWHWSVPPGNYSRTIAIAFLAGWALNGFGDRTVGRSTPIVYCLLGYWLWVALSTAQSADPSVGWPHVGYLGKIVLPFLAGITLVRTDDQLRLLSWTILGSCAYLAFEANLAYLNGFSLANGKFIALDNNSFSILMVTTYGFALTLAFLVECWWRRWLFLGCAAAMAHVPMLAMSRGGMVGALIATVTAFVVLPKTGRTLRGFALALAIGSLLAGPSVLNEFDTVFADDAERDFSAQSRIDLWIDCLEVAARHPIFGIGQDHWGTVAESFGWPAGKEAHSLWFQSAAELGVPGVLFLAAFYIVSVWLFWGTYRSGASEFKRQVSLALIPAIMGFVTSAAFVTVEGFELPYYMVLIGACAIKLHSVDLASSPNATPTGSIDLSDELAGQSTPPPLKHAVHCVRSVASHA